MSRIVIREPLFHDAEQLATMLNDDNGLRADLGMVGDTNETAQHFLEYVRDWCQKNHAVTYVIVHGDVAIGTISLSRRNPDGESAGIGYWIGTKHRRKGYCGLAFDAVIKQAIN
ncbi:MAG: GNAT family N-acetyltransferase, partial [Victivallaceae bacterium]|nr:GNAT family N-acetyltransferase [Victivallaceae bacterium]